MLMKKVHSIETIITANEYEALLLENNLIKQHFPKYNIALKDGKTYPVVRITAEKVPRIFKTRHIVDDGSLYFGPFVNSGAVDTSLEYLTRIYKTRKCKRFIKRDNPCLYYHIGRCDSPCTGKVTEDEYKKSCEKIAECFSGETEKLLIDLKEKMHIAAIKKDYENAAFVRDAIFAIEDLSANDTGTIDFDGEGRDYIAFASEGLFITYSVFQMRFGKLVGRDLYRSKTAANDAESLVTFIISYYNTDRPPPLTIYTQFEKNAQNDFLHLKQYLKGHFGYDCAIVPPDSKRHEAALAMAAQNAKEDLRKRMKERGAGPALLELKTALSLSRYPETIEGFDIAQLDGRHPVASLISFNNGIPDKKNYRIFKLRTVVGVVDDFEAMREAVRRRYKRLLTEQKELPDFILIDGGIGQVNAASNILKALSLEIPVIGLAKRNEEIYLPGKSTPLVLPRRSDALRLLQRVRDETHRFATSKNTKLRTKENIESDFRNLPHIASAREKKLIKTYATMDALREALKKDGSGVLCALLGVSDSQAKEIASKIKE
jgi:excinuclease ABC subunit C